MHRSCIATAPDILPKYSARKPTRGVQPKRLTAGGQFSLIDDDVLRNMPPELLHLGVVSFYHTSRTLWSLRDGLAIQRQIRDGGSAGGIAARVTEQRAALWYSKYLTYLTWVIRKLRNRLPSGPELRVGELPAQGTTVYGANELKGGTLSDMYSELARERVVLFHEVMLRQAAKVRGSIRLPRFVGSVSGFGLRQTPVCQRRRGSRQVTYTSKNVTCF